MADPLVEQIAAVLVARLEAIDPGDSTIAYHYKPARVVRPAREGWAPEHLLIVVTQGSAAPNYDESTESNGLRVDWTQAFGILLVIKPPDDNPEPLDAIRNRFAADVMRAITAPGNWHTMGGLAINSRFGESIAFDSDDDGGYDGLILTVEVTHRIHETNPYLQG